MLRHWRHIVLAIAIIAAVAGVSRTLRKGSDFTGFYEAAAHFWEHGTPHKDRSVERYPPTFAILLAPIGIMPLWLAVCVWQGLNVLALAKLPNAFRRLSGIRTGKQGLAWLIAVPFIVANLTLAQSGPILLYLVTAGLARLRSTGSGGRWRDWGSGAMLGIAGTMKVLPLAFAPLAALRRRSWQPIAAIVLAVAAVYGASMLRAGPGVVLEDTVRWWREVRQDQSPLIFAATGRSMRPNNQGLAVVLLRTLTDAAGRQPAGTQWASYRVETINTLYQAMVALAGAGWVLAAWAVMRSRSRRAFLGLFAVTAIGTLIVSPIVWTHYFLWLLPAMLFLLNNRPRLLIGCAAVSVVGLTSDALRSLGVHIFTAMMMYAVIVRDLWMAQPAGLPLVALRAKYRRLSPADRLGAALLIATLVLVAGSFLPAVDVEIWTDVVLEPMADINLAVAAVLSLRLAWASNTTNRLWQILAIALTFATIDNLFDIHDLIYFGVTDLAGWMAGHDVFMGGDDMVVVAYATVFAAVVGWRFRRQLLKRRRTCVLFGLAGVLVVLMALLDASEVSPLHWLEGPCETVATAMVLAGLMAESLRQDSQPTPGPMPAAA